MTFMDEIIKIIPFMNDEILQNLIINYCNKYTYGKKTSYYNIRDNFLSPIKKRLSELLNTTTISNKINSHIKNKTISIEGFNNNSVVYGINNNNIVIKSHVISSKNFIETLLHTILYIYNKENIVEILKVGFSKNNKLYQIMHKIDNGVQLSKYIEYLYGTTTEENIYKGNKNELMFKVFQKVAFTLMQLQNQCSFIHGDLHSANLYVSFYDIEEGNIYDLNNIYIQFIDFGYSVVRLPEDFGNNILLSSVHDINFGKILDIEKDETLKALDLFHLFNSLSDIDENNYNNRYDEFRQLIKNIIDLYMTHKNKTNMSRYNSPHQFTKSKNYNTIENLSILYPHNFIKLKFNNDRINISNVSHINKPFSKINLSNSNTSHNRFNNTPLKSNISSKSIQHTVRRNTSPISTSRNIPHTTRKGTPPKRTFQFQNNYTSPSRKTRHNL